MSIDNTPVKGRRLWLIVELVILAGIIAGILLINFGKGSLTIPQSIGYIFIALGFFCIIGIEIYLAIRGPSP